jgi:hypothetical protein
METRASSDNPSRRETATRLTEIGLLNEIYDFYRTVLLNEKYYANRLTQYKRMNLAYEIILAVGTSTAIAGWAIWQESRAGKIFWSGFAGLVTLLAVIKPMLQTPKEIENYTMLFTGYRALYLNVDSIVTSVRRKEAVTPQDLQLLDAAEKQYQTLALKDDVNPNKKLVRKCQDEVNRQIPVGSLWYVTPHQLSESKQPNF